MVAYFQLQPPETELQQLAEEYWEKSGEKEHELEKAAFDAGEAIRKGDYTLANLEAIVRWKSERAVHYLIGNSSEKIRRVLSVAASPESSTEAAVNALLELHGVDLPVASAILAAIYPERYTVLDFRALEALGTRAPRRTLLRGVSSLLQAPGRKQHRETAKRAARAHAVAHARSGPVGVDSQPHRVARGLQLPEPSVVRSVPCL